MIRNKIRYLTLFILIFIMYVGFRGRTLFTILAVLVILPFFTIIQAKRMINKLEVIVSFSKEMTGRKGSNMMTITVDNKLHIPNCGVTVTMFLANSFYDDKKMVKVDVPIEGCKKNSVDIEVSGDNCGYVYVDNVSVRVCDILCLHAFVSKKEVEARYMIIPSYIYSLSDKTTFKPEDDSDVVMHETGEDTSEIESIREYRAGDRIQRIHWKLTCKLEEMMVKEYAINYDVDVTLVCELVKRNEMECYDELLDALYSLMIELSEVNERYLFYYVNNDHVKTSAVSISSREDVMDAISQLFFIKPYEEHLLTTTLVKAQGIEPVMTLRWKNGSEDPDKVLYEFDNKVVLVWE